MEPHPDLYKFLQLYNKPIQSLFLETRSYLYPIDSEISELIYDNYNAVAVAYSKSVRLKDAFCHLAIYPNYVNIGFNRGAEIDLESVPLRGTGKLIRHMRLENTESLNAPELRQSILRAIVHSIHLNPALAHIEDQPVSKVMSISSKKRRPHY